MRYLTTTLLCALLCSCGTYANSKCVYNTADCDYLEWHGGNNPSLIMKGVRAGDATRSAGSFVGTATAGAAGIMTARMTDGLVR